MKVFGKEIGKDFKIPPFLDNFFGKLLPHKNNEELVTIPSTNISDEEKVFELSMALPGLDKNDVQIQIEDDYLIISGHKSQSLEEKNKNWVRTEFVGNSFYRAFALPTNADPNRIEAKMKNGILDIKVGKRPQAERKTRIIEVA
ncbi:Hsp20/alpha crystallin family protein [Maribacter polysiphoniae]|uniref:HSP20 family protein n=1 Tax=Maribacter polysiphoniae TaxID=429344 RepID=A0A316EA81_9FLAO|nr:Hsp20/alpha crystallin family protein [Maribacter polysiphoniae]MBD1260193.1 Hsp20/alpha crystallin family protein [Maribacter polysiphoniae]PWK25653.1 HSP20 family protein [Maribacter polysiphoniae]